MGLIIKPLISTLLIIAYFILNTYEFINETLKSIKYFFNGK